MDTVLILLAGAAFGAALGAIGASMCRGARYVPSGRITLQRSGRSNP
jgi:hypothetical protein